MTLTIWFAIVGALFIFMALSRSVLLRLPLTTALVYLATGVVLGPLGFGLLSLDPLKDAGLLERFTEVAVLISLFTAGLQLRVPLSQKRWRLPVRLASVSMVVTVLLVTAVGVLGLGLPLGAAVLLGAVLAPTDPVLASDVTVEGPTDQDRLRFSLTGEAGMNDGSAFPFVMLGLGLLGLHELGPMGLRWLAVDVIWAVVGGLAIGGLLGTLVGHLVLYLRRAHREAVGLDDFLALGLIASSYGAALLASSYGFLAVFAAGVALRRVEQRASGPTAPEDVIADGTRADSTEDLTTHPEKAPAYMVQAVLGFNEQLERIGEVAIVVIVGGLLSEHYLSHEALWFAPLLFLVIRPIAVAVGLLGTRMPPLQWGFMSWFGIRGIGSIYYLMYALEHGVSGPVADQLAGLTLTIVAVSAVVHGVSVTPLMAHYRRLTDRARTVRDRRRAGRATRHTAPPA
jgi:NhaP-type Na+/H+ or K+/H+ antiporter